MKINTDERDRIGFVIGMELFVLTDDPFNELSCFSKISNWKMLLARWNANNSGTLDVEARMPDYSKLTIKT